jgi:CheY-like chemotaxis protein
MSDATKHKKVLLVDDDESNRLLVTINLNRYDITVVEAINGKDALSKLQNDNIFDLILMDIRMPYMDGIETSKIIINEMKLNIPIIMMSASTDIYEMNDLCELGIKNYILKPITQHKILKTIINTLK